MKCYREGDWVIIRNVAEEDYDKFYDIFHLRCRLKHVLNTLIMKQFWENASSDNMQVYTVIEKKSNEVCGFCQLDKLQSEIPEIGIMIADDYMGNGYAQEAVKLLLLYASEHYNKKRYIWKANRDNAASRHIAEKLGGQLVPEEPVWPMDKLDRDCCRETENSGVDENFRNRKTSQGWGNSREEKRLQEKDVPFIYKYTIEFSDEPAL